MIIKLILIVLAVVAFVAWFIKKANQVRETKARVRLAHMKWLLEKADECDLEADAPIQRTIPQDKIITDWKDRATAKRTDDSTATLPVLPRET